MGGMFQLFIKMQPQISYRWYILDHIIAYPDVDHSYFAQLLSDTKEDKLSFELIKFEEVYLHPRSYIS